MKYGYYLVYKYAISDMVLIKDQVNPLDCYKCHIPSLSGIEV